MGAIDFALVHACQVLTTTQDNRLNFTSGSAVYTVGATATGQTSEASGVIKSVSVASGSWVAGNAAGYLILHSVSGAFLTGETITDNGVTPGLATTSGLLIPQTNAAGTPTTTTVTLPSDSTYYDCLFSKITTSGNDVSATGAGKVIISSPMVSLPATAVVQEGDYIRTTEPNWAGTYEVQSIDSPEIPYTGIVDHKEAFLEEVSKRG